MTHYRDKTTKNRKYSAQRTIIVYDKTIFNHNDSISGYNDDKVSLGNFLIPSIDIFLLLTKLNGKIIAIVCYA